VYTLGYDRLSIDYIIGRVCGVLCPSGVGGLGDSARDHDRDRAISARLAMGAGLGNVHRVAGDREPRRQAVGARSAVSLRPVLVRVYGRVFIRRPRRTRGAMVALSFCPSARSKSRWRRRLSSGIHKYGSLWNRLTARLRAPRLIARGRESPATHCCTACGVMSSFSARVVCDSSRTSIADFNLSLKSTIYLPF
jgi:hypothetical protein